MQSITQKAKEQVRQRFTFISSIPTSSSPVGLYLRLGSRARSWKRSPFIAWLGRGLCRLVHVQISQFGSWRYRRSLRSRKMEWFFEAKVRSVPLSSSVFYSSSITQDTPVGGDTILWRDLRCHLNSLLSKVLEVSSNPIRASLLSLLYLAPFRRSGRLAWWHHWESNPSCWQAIWKNFCSNQSISSLLRKWVQNIKKEKDRLGLQSSPLEIRRTAVPSYHCFSYPRELVWCSRFLNRFKATALLETRGNLTWYGLPRYICTPTRLIVKQQHSTWIRHSMNSRLKLPKLIIKCCTINIQVHHVYVYHQMHHAVPLIKSTTMRR